MCSLGIAGEWVGIALTVIHDSVVLLWYYCGITLNVAGAMSALRDYLD